MAFPERFSNLPDYAFPRLRTLLDGQASGSDDPVEMTIGTPMHPYPHWIRDILIDNLDGFRGYPPNDGTSDLLSSITDWIARRYDVRLDPATRVMALNGTREGLYNVAMALGVEQKNGGRTPIVLTPNPFYPAYAMAAVSIGAQPIFVPATSETGFLPDFERLGAEVLNRVTLVYFCSPSNPQGAIAGWDYWTQLFALAETYDFKVLADECYAEIYRGTPPPGALEVAAKEDVDPERVVAFHSLSKRSNLAGLRSGFVASGPENIRRIKKQRAYSGSPLPLPIQKVSQQVWSDEDHVIENRALYIEKFLIADEIMRDVRGYRSPDAGFFLWLPVENGEAATIKLWRETGVKVLPGAYLAREFDGTNPGQGYVRVALVAPKTEMQRGLIRLRDCLY